MTFEFRLKHNGLHYGTIPQKNGHLVLVLCYTLSGIIEWLLGLLVGGVSDEACDTVAIEGIPLGS